MNASRWMIVGAVTLAFILLSFVLIPKLFDTSEDEPKATLTAPSHSSSAPPPQPKYGEAVFASNPTHFWRFGSAAPANDELATSHLTMGADILPLGSSAVKDNVGAVDCAATKRSTMSSQTPEMGTGDFSVEVWFNTASSTGGQIVSFGNSAEGQSKTVTRSLYLDGTGFVYFGIRADKRQVTKSEKAYADGKWHQAVGTYSATGGLTLYVDGQPVATEPKGVGAVDLEQGFWRICGDNLSGWPAASNPMFRGSIDEVSVYPTALPAEQVQAHFAAAQGG